jgi:hypothetical protein
VEIYVDLRRHGLFSTRPDAGSHYFGFMLQDVGDNDLCAFRCGQTRRAFGRIIEFEPSIAVLPFTNMSGDNEKEDFADGMLDEIIPCRPYPLAPVSGPPTSRVG